jgi:AraC-like DNA-binding protein
VKGLSQPFLSLGNKWCIARCAPATRKPVRPDAFTPLAQRRLGRWPASRGEWASRSLQVGRANETPISRLLAATYVMTPPYSRLDAVSLPESLRRSPRGTVIVTADRSPESVGRIARAAPSALLIVEARVGEMLSVAEVDGLRRLGAGAVLATTGGEPELATLVRGAREASRSMRGQIGPRLALLGHSIAPALEAVVELLFDGPVGWRASHWAAAMGESVRSLERRCTEEWRAPSPRRWLELVRAIRAVLLLQQRRRASVETVLAEAGFPSPRTGRTMVRRTGGIPPATVRDLIGWYWIVEHWCRTYWSGTGLPGRSGDEVPVCHP